MDTNLLIIIVVAAVALGLLLAKAIIDDGRKGGAGAPPYPRESRREKFEKLLDPRWWKGRRPLKKDQYWQVMASPVNPQSQAILDVAQGRFNSHILTACDLNANAELRLRALDRALAISEYMDAIASDMERAPEQVKEMERKAREEAQGGPQRE